MSRAERGGGAHPANPSPAGPDDDSILCCVCGRPVTHPAWADGWCWVDPGGQMCAAHGDCLRALGEHDLKLKDTG